MEATRPGCGMVIRGTKWLRVKEQTSVPRGDESPNREVNLPSTPEALFSSQKWRGDWQLVGEAERCSGGDKRDSAKVSAAQTSGLMGKHPTRGYSA